mmetsp:Transcript_31270/g.60364  ORF Transcript_31270/g.60364 Transcript_31270/m.60364 type:complete len:305 (+) Transcript_31270:81-995(+)
MRLSGLATVIVGVCAVWEDNSNSALKGQNPYHIAHPNPHPNPHEAAPFRNQSLTAEQLLEFHKNGYLVIKNAVGSEHVSKALRYINRAIEDATKGRPVKDDEGTGNWHWRSHPAIMNLYRKGLAWRYSENLMGEKNFTVPTAAQVAIRYPLAYNEHPPKKLRRSGWHVDGWQYGRGGTNQFSLLVGVALNPWREEMVGNFVVFPGKHHEMARNLAAEGGEEALRVALSKSPGPDLDVDPVQIIAEPGDIILAHSLLPHLPGPNHGHDIRYAVFFRVAHDQKDQTQFEDLFCDFEPVKTAFLQEN